MAIVDDLASSHGRLMAGCVAFVSDSIEVLWIPIDLQLPERLLAVDEVDAVALPFAVRRAGKRDRFTSRLADAIAELNSRGIEVFVSESRPGSNPLTSHGVACGPPQLPFQVPGGDSASGACVISAARHASGLTSPTTPTVR